MEIKPIFRRRRYLGESKKIIYYINNQFIMCRYMKQKIKFIHWKYGRGKIADFLPVFSPVPVIILFRRAIWPLA
jgi:hypothetical protein